MGLEGRNGTGEMRDTSKKGAQGRMNTTESLGAMLRYVTLI
jgi:hypothetical protein